MAAIDVEALLGFMIYVTLPASYASIFEQEFPREGHDHIRAKVIARDSKTVQFNVYIDHWHQRYSQAEYLLKLGRLMNTYGHTSYLVNYGPAGKFRPVRQAVS